MVINTQKGYAILFTMVIIGIIMAFVTGASNRVYKQIILSSTAKDSQVAFYQADMAGECAIYLTSNPSIDLSSLNSVICGVDKDGNPLTLTITPLGSDVYSLKTSLVDEPCFEIVADISLPPDVNIKTRGYNTCNQSSLRRLERGIEIEY